MRIWCISDTHCEHERLVVPDGIDAVIHAGDESTSRDLAQNEIECRRFAEWWDGLPVREKFFSPGNHSIAVSRGWITPSRTYIQEAVDVLGVKAYMSPYTPRWGEGWAYMMKRERIGLVWDNINLDTEILVTHGPPKGILDITRDRDTGALIQVGCNALRKRVEAIKPKLHIFGHIHDEKGVLNHGVYERNGTRYVNCSVCDIKGRFKHNGIVVTL